MSRRLLRRILPVVYGALHQLQGLPRRHVLLLATAGIVLVAGAAAGSALLLRSGDAPGDTTHGPQVGGGTKTGQAPSSGTTPPSANKPPTPATIPSTKSTPAPVAPAPPPPTPTPGSVLGLTNWKLALPINTAHAGNPDEIKQPELAGFTSPPYFQLTSAQNGVVFQAHAGGATTPNSSYPRSELREMTANGTVEAGWSNATGTHTMVVRQAITHVPVVKPEVVAAQIHDASDDVVMVKLSGSRLFVEASSDNIGDLNTAYALGTVYTVKIVATNNRMYVYYNDVLKVDYARGGTGYYFKAGCYTQSNVSKGDAADAYAQVVIYGLQVSHAQ